MQIKMHASDYGVGVFRCSRSHFSCLEAQRLFPDKSSRADCWLTVKAESCTASPCYVEGQDLLGRWCVFALIAFLRHTRLLSGNAHLLCTRARWESESQNLTRRLWWLNDRWWSNCATAGPNCVSIVSRCNVFAISPLLSGNCAERVYAKIIPVSVGLIPVNYISFACHTLANDRPWLSYCEIKCS